MSRSGGPVLKGRWERCREELQKRSDSWRKQLEVRSVRMLLFFA